MLLIAEELPEDAARWQGQQETPVAFLPLPFNTRRLLQAVERLLGRTNAV